jgi:preprotein translocase subunit SecE
MKANVQDGDTRFDGLKWAVVAAIAGAAAWGNVKFGGEPLLFRVLALLLVAAVAIAIALQTAQGVAFWELAKSARTEIRKVVWPTRQETTQTTLVVVGVVLVMALILWGLDSLLGWLASMLIG